jgi:hypothetical protein
MAEFLLFLLLRKLRRTLRSACAPQYHTAQSQRPMAHVGGILGHSLQRLCLEWLHLEGLGHVYLVYIIDKCPVFFKLVGVIVVLLSMLVNLGPCSVKLPVDCLDGNLRTIVLSGLAI